MHLLLGLTILLLLPLSAFATDIERPVLVGGKESGSERVSSGDGSYRSQFSYNDRGRGHVGRPRWGHPATLGTPTIPTQSHEATRRFPTDESPSLRHARCHDFAPQPTRRPRCAGLLSLHVALRTPRLAVRRGSTDRVPDCLPGLPRLASWIAPDCPSAPRLPAGLPSRIARNLSVVCHR